MKESFQNFRWEFVLGSDHVHFSMSFFMYRLATFLQFQHLSSSFTLGLVGTLPILSSSKYGRTIINFQLSVPQSRHAHFNGRRVYATQLFQGCPGSLFNEQVRKQLLLDSGFHLTHQHETSSGSSWISFKALHFLEILPCMICKSLFLFLLISSSGSFELITSVRSHTTICHVA